MDKKLSTFSQDAETLKNYTFTMPSRENEDSGHVKVITFSLRPDSSLPSIHDSSLEPSHPSRPPKPPNPNP